MAHTKNSLARVTNTSNCGYTVSLAGSKELVLAHLDGTHLLGSFPVQRERGRIQSRRQASILNHIGLGTCPGWVTLNKSLCLFRGLSFLICVMGIMTSHRTGVRISDKVNVQSACHTAGLGHMVALIMIAINM